MKQFYSILFFVFGCYIASAQQNKSYSSLVERLNIYLKAYEDIHPNYQEYYMFDSIDLPRKDIQRIRKDYSANDKSRMDSIVVFDIQYYLQKEIQRLCDNIIDHELFNTQGLQGAIKSFALGYVVSEDKKLHNFSLEENTGGTYRSQISWMYYTELDSNSRTYANSSKKVNPYEIFNSDGYTGIHSVETTEGTKYILTGYVRGCSYCFETHISLISFKNGLFEQEFYESVNSRSWKGGVQYNHDSLKITVDYITDDLTEDCTCIYSMDEYEEEADKEKSSENNDRETKCHCIYQFNGTTFELMKASWEYVE